MIEMTYNRILVRASEIGIEDVAVVVVPEVTAAVSDLAVIDGVGSLPLSPKWFFDIYDVLSGSDRGAGKRDKGDKSDGFTRGLKVAAIDVDGVVKGLESAEGVVYNRMMYRVEACMVTPRLSSLAIWCSVKMLAYLN